MIEKRGRPIGTKIRRRRYLTEDEMEQFVKEREKAGRKYDLLFTLAWYFAMRVGEVVRLTLADVNLDQHQLTIRPEKKGRERVYELPEQVEQKYRRWLRERPTVEANLYVFPSSTLPRSGHLSRDAAQAEFRALCRRAAVPMPRSIHDLRHSRAQDLLRGGEDLGTVKKFLRHRDIASTQAYLDDEEDARNERRIAAHSARFL
jgi:integrase/recombinase XerD